MKIVLVDEMIIQRNLSYQAACEALEKAAACPVMDGYVFSITNEHSEANLWTLQAMSEKLRADFLADPEKYVIEIDERKGDGR